MDDGQVFLASHDSGAGVLVISGAIDEQAIDDFRQALRTATEDYTVGVLVDLDSVTFIPSMAVGVLMGAMARAPGTRVIASEGTIGRKVLDVLGLYEYAATGRRSELDSSGA